jgi:hypothetical protein
MAAREWWLWTVRRPIVEVMRLEIEFFVRSHAQPDGKTIRRNSGQFDVHYGTLIKASAKKKPRTSRTGAQVGRKNSLN